MKRHTLLWVLVATLGVALSVPALAGAQVVKRVPAQPINSVEGVDLYDAYCAVCHGQDGKGNGPAAAALKVPMPDLTTVAQRSEGGFSHYAVREVIMGRTKMTPAHGSPDMPIWGPVFRALDCFTEMTTLRVVNLTKYIESMQAKTGAESL